MHKCLSEKPSGYKACRKCRDIKGGQPRKIVKITIDEVDHFVGTKHKLYKLRYYIMERCYKAKPSNFSAYQGKGIKVCEEWLNNPTSFYTWSLKAGWRPGLTIDRTDPNKDYCPENCTFLSLEENVSKSYRDNPRAGDTNPFSKLISLQVKQIKSMILDGKPTVEIARIFNVHRTTISCIKHEKTWKHIKID